MNRACWTLFGALVLVTGCKRAEPGSCYRAQENVCVEYDASTGSAAKRMCVGYVWTPGERSCKTDGRLGTCQGHDGARYFYAGAPNNFTAETAKTTCVTSGGSWAR